MATVTEVTGSLKNFSTEIKNIVWASAGDVTVEVDTDLSEIYAWFASDMWGANTGHTNEDMGLLELDETVTSGVITVDTDGQITVNRLEASADGTLATQQSQIILFGKS